MATAIDRRLSLAGRRALLAANLGSVENGIVSGTATAIDPAHYTSGRAAGYAEGPGRDLPPVDGELVQHPIAGTVLRIRGLQQLYERQATLIEDDKRYRLHVVLIDTLARANVVFGIRWLDADLRNVAGGMLYKPPGGSLGDWPRIEAFGYVSRHGLGTGDIIPPPSAVFMRTKIRTTAASEDVFIASMGHQIISRPAAAVSKISS